MKRKNVILIIIGIFVVILLSFFGYNLIDKQKEKNLQTQEKITTMKNDYELFAKEATHFNEIKVNYDKKMNHIFYNTLPDENENILKIIEEYHSSLKNITKIGNRLKENCELNLKKEEVKTICESYKTSYNTANEVYKQDIEKYKKLILDYNEWAKNDSEYKELKEYQEKED